MSRTSWRDSIDQAQLILTEHPDRCFVCGNEVARECPGCLIQAYRDPERQERLAVVCGRESCRLQLEDADKGTWVALFQALTHWPDKAIYPHGPYWLIRRPHHLTFRTDPRRTAHPN